jgi:hypothetical protein
MTQPVDTPLTYLIAQYLSLEELSVTEELLDLCGASIGTKALPLLKRRLLEEEAHAVALEARGYVRMREKCEQLGICLKHLIEELEGVSDGTINDTLEA